MTKTIVILTLVNISLVAVLFFNSFYSGEIATTSNEFSTVGADVREEINQIQSQLKTIQMTSTLQAPTQTDAIASLQEDLVQMKRLLADYSTRGVAESASKNCSNSTEFFASANNGQNIVNMLPTQSHWCTLSSAGMGSASRPSVTYGSCTVDVTNDGYWQLIAVSNGNGYDVPANCGGACVALGCVQQQKPLSFPALPLDQASDFKDLRAQVAQLMIAIKALVNGRSTSGPNSACAPYFASISANNAQQTQVTNFTSSDYFCTLQQTGIGTASRPSTTYGQCTVSLDSTNRWALTALSNGNGYTAPANCAIGCFPLRC